MTTPYREGSGPSEARLFNEKGGINIKGIFWTLVLVSALYAAYKFVPPYFSYYMLKTDVDNETKVAHMYTDEKLAQRILQKAWGWNVPIKREDIVIERGREIISVSIRYTVTLDFVSGHSRELVFDINSIRPLKESSGILG